MILTMIISLGIIVGIVWSYYVLTYIKDALEELIFTQQPNILDFAVLTSNDYVAMSFAPVDVIMNATKHYVADIAIMGMLDREHNTVVIMTGNRDVHEFDIPALAEETEDEELDLSVFYVSSDGMSFTLGEYEFSIPELIECGDDEEGKVFN